MALGYVDSSSCHRNDVQVCTEVIRFLLFSSVIYSLSYNIKGNTIKMANDQ